jgi:hypothetical protein
MFRGFLRKLSQIGCVFLVLSMFWAFKREEYMVPQDGELNTKVKYWGNLLVLESMQILSL